VGIKDGHDKMGGFHGNMIYGWGIVLVIFLLTGLLTTG
jgi:tetrahydromethanopterin S-methyltransferase subunit B